MEKPDKYKSPALRGVTFHEPKLTLQDLNLSGRFPQSQIDLTGYLRNKHS